MTERDDRHGDNLVAKLEAIFAQGERNGQANDTVLGYGCAAQLYRDAGWPGVLPLRPREKVPHLAGFTGHDGAWPTDEQIAASARLKALRRRQQAAAMGGNANES